MAEGPRIILCADDYAQTPGISAGIRKLAAAGRLSATSAMTNSPDWPAEGDLIAPLRDRLALGLHLTFTHGVPLGPMPRLAPGGGFPSLGRLLSLAMTGRLGHRAFRAEISAEIERQLDAFQEVTGTPPDHVDGHQHVHVLPGILGPLTAALSRRYPGRPILVRDPRDRPDSLLLRGASGKALFVATLASGLGPAARRHGLLTNHGFSGFSSFGTVPYEKEFKSFLLRVGPRPMIMCHPGEGAEPDDPIAHRREEELAYLMGLDGLKTWLWRPAPRRAGEAVDWNAGGSHS